ncbi:acyl-CoA dehydrogenase family protein [Spongiibacter taiwanensis]|uniref:acyl-CoA dehydrogenase family protein n=1 Tax=Spongiibacter taiwanensis TaxID=1748242 RepID=UPI00203628C5|nr:acyl-CoA dehydrogenase family protein [Spongiibacter taiwanensis]USA44047.1 acyl-CoA dehydrogenase family protein [Spongiibacter taiwanensis]
MDFSFTDEQQLLRRSLQGFLSDRYRFEQRREVAAAEPGWQPAIWQAFAQELGILALPFPESQGGLNGGAVDIMLVMEEMGRALVVEPFLETAVLSGTLLKADGGPKAQQWIGDIIEGRAVVSLAWSEPHSRFNPAAIETVAQKDGDGWLISGHKSVVIAGPWSNAFIVSARTAGGPGDASGVSLFLVSADGAGLSAKHYPTIDGRRASDLQFDQVRVSADDLLGPVDGGLPLLEMALDTALAAQCAEAVGVLSVLQEDTVSYSKTRKQFGQAIGNFQALQHRMVDMYMQLEMARSACLLATLNLDADPIERAINTSAAKVTVAKACRFIGQNAVQLHGGMGMTDELNISHYFRRATQIEVEFGSVDFHLARHARLRKQAA